MGFFKLEYWGGLPFPPPGDLPNPGIEPTSPASPEPTSPASPVLQTDSLRAEPSPKIIIS